VAQKEFKKGNFAKIFDYSVFFGDYSTIHYLVSEKFKNCGHVNTQYAQMNFDCQISIL